jgi:hypothetical protein
MANFNKFNMILSRLLFILVLLTLSAQALCEAYIHHHERQHGIPHNLLRGPFPESNPAEMLLGKAPSPGPGQLTPMANPMF